MSNHGTHPHKSRSWYPGVLCPEAIASTVLEWCVLDRYDPALAKFVFETVAHRIDIAALELNLLQHADLHSLMRLCMGSSFEAHSTMLLNCVRASPLQAQIFDLWHQQPFHCPEVSEPRICPLPRRKSSDELLILLMWRNKL